MGKEAGEKMAAMAGLGMDVALGIATQSTTESGNGSQML